MYTSTFMCNQISQSNPELVHVEIVNEPPSTDTSQNLTPPGDSQPTNEPPNEPTNESLNEPTNEPSNESTKYHTYSS